MNVRIYQINMKRDTKDVYKRQAENRIKGMIAIRDSVRSLIEMQTADSVSYTHLEWLDRHMEKASRGIRFITPDYKEKFKIPDGYKIRITLSDGEQLDRTCRYIDDYHLEVGSNLYHICEFARCV